MEVIPAVELSSQLGDREVHILGYFIDVRNKTLRSTLTRLQRSRRARLEEILAKLSRHNINIDPGLILSGVKGHSVGRLHVAEILIENGHSSSLYEVFRDFLGPEGKAFVPKERLSVKDAMELVHSAGGAAVLAHPGGFFTPEEVCSFAECGLDGIEAYYPSHSEITTLKWLEVARGNDLVVTGGSDFHGRSVSETPLGAVRIPRSKVEALRERSRRYAVGRLS